MLELTYERIQVSYFFFFFNLKSFDSINERVFPPSLFVESSMQKTVNLIFLFTATSDFSLT